MGRIYAKLRVLGCLFVLAVIPSLTHAYYQMLRIEGSTDVTKGVTFTIRVTACDSNGNKLTSSDPDWDYARRAYIYYECSDPQAKIQDNLGRFVSIGEFNSTNPRLWEAERTDILVLETVGTQRIRVLEKNVLGIEPGSISPYVHKYVDHFEISLVLPLQNRIAGVPFAIEIRALNEDGNIAKTFNDDLAIWAIMWPEDYPEPTMLPEIVPGTSFSGGRATVSVTIYGSHPDTRNVRISCENTVTHGNPPYYAQGQSDYFSVNPASYQNILLIAPGEVYRPGKLGGGGKEALPDSQTAGRPFGVRVYTVDQYWNPVTVSPAVLLAFTSSDPEAILPSFPDTVMDRNPKTFSITFKTVSVERQRLEVTEGTRNSVSMIPVMPAPVLRFEFDTIASPQKTTEPFPLRITAYDEFGNVANYNQEATLGTNYGPDYVSPRSVAFVNGRVNLSAQVTRAGNKFKLSVTDGTHLDWSNEFDVKVGDFTRLLILLEGETHTPGIGDGKDGTPQSIYAGGATTATIYACDVWWNPTPNNVTVTFTSVTGYIEAPSSLALEDGYGRCLVRFRTAYDSGTRSDEPQTMTATSSGISGTSSPITVRPGTYQKMVLVAPGERLDPGTLDADGKSGSPATQVAGTSFTLTVAVTDAYWNPISSGFPATIYFNSGDNHPLVRFAGLAKGSAVSMGARIKDFSSTLITLANPQWVTVTDGSKSGQVNIRVIHGSLDHFAFNNISVNPTAGQTIYNVTIIAQDSYNNRVENFSSTSTLSSTTGVDTFIPTTAPFTNGQSIINVIVYKADINVRLTCTYGGRSGQSNTFSVNPGPYAGVILLLPGQTHRPGNIVLRGKSGTAFPYKVGNPAIQTTVYAVDSYWNRVNPPDPEPRIEISTSRYLAVEPANPQTMTSGEVIFWTALKTAATAQVLIGTDIGTGINDTSNIDVNPGDFRKLQVIAPGEIPDPGSDLGKTGAIQTQVAGVSFEVIVRAVDQYWNLVPSINGESIDLISNEDEDLDARYSPMAFVNGSVNFSIWLDGNNEDIDVTAINREPPPFVDQYTALIHVDRGYQYVVQVPSSCKAGTLSLNTFSMTVRLVDEDNNVVIDANNWFRMVPCLASDHSPATDPEGLGVEEYRLTNGVATFEQSYDIVEKIAIVVSDDFGRGPVFSSAIDVRETALKYRVDVPTEATAGNVFEMVVSIIDTGTEKVVPTRDRQVDLVPISSAEPGREGRLYVTDVGLSKGTWKIVNQWYTKAEAISIRASDAETYDPPAEANSSLPFKVLPGTVKKLQILAPGEEPRPGEMSYIESGKDSSNIHVQGLEIEFPVTVYAVDQYWNLVDEFNGGIVYLSSEGSFSSNPVESSFTYGLATFIVTLHQAGSSFTLKAEAQSPTGLEPQSVTVPMEAAIYRITSGVTGARTIDSFRLTIELVDLQTGQPKSGANNPFILTVHTASGGEAPGNWTKMGGSSVLDNGRAEIWVNYDTVGSIRFRVTDSFGRPPGFTEPIDIRPLGLRYDLESPGKAEAGKEFPLTIKLVDTGVGKPVTPNEYYRQVKLVACSSPDGKPAEGKLKVETLYLKGGMATIQESYNLAQYIYIEASDAGSYEPPSALGRTIDIEVIGTPVTVLKLEGVYNEINGGLYLRSSTVVTILSVPPILAETILYRLNERDWNSYKEPFTLPPGVYIVEYYGIDKYGHKEAINTSKRIYVSFFSDGVSGIRNRPNPFRAGKEETLIEYNLSQVSNVTITIYDLLGQEVWHESYRAGENGGSTVNSVPWNGRNLSGEVVGNGGYICRIWIEREKRHMTRRIAVAK